MRLTVEQERALQMLRNKGVVRLGEISVLLMNSMRDLTKLGLARFGRWPSRGETVVGYALVRGVSLLRAVA